MERKVLLFCGTVGFLGLLSAALAFAAEATRVKKESCFAARIIVYRNQTHCATANMKGSPGSLGLVAVAWDLASAVLTRVPGECTYPKSPALYLGLVSAISIAIAQAIINTVAGCICCKRNTNPASSNWTVALISFVVSWITFIVAFLLLLTGAALNDQRGDQKMYFGGYCYVVKPGVFSAGAVFSVASVSLGIVYFVSLQTSKSSQPWWGGSTPQNQGIALGQPQIPTMSTQPAFVHEDTYNRQQMP